jgi:hypothetical protein
MIVSVEPEGLSEAIDVSAYRRENVGKKTITAAR